jgi:Zn-dependent M28 family amino/carboxypeptidase
VVGMAEKAAVEVIAAAGGDLGAARAAAPGPLGDAAVEIRVARTREVHQPPNVVAMRRGADPALRDTYVLITAHFDHIGVGEPDERGDSIFSGADDNASGTAALLEIASAFMALPAAPARSVVFLAVSGEEKGLLGSMAFAERPTIPLDDVVANVNLDMVGRSAPDTVIAIGQEYSTLEDVVRRIADRPGLGLTIIEDPAPEEMYFFRSDQLSFIQRGIPAVFFTTGDHPDYHKQSDLPERINADKLARVARLGFHLAFEIAMDPRAPEWTEEGWREVQEKLQAVGF